MMNTLRTVGVVGRGAVFVITVDIGGRLGDREIGVGDGLQRSACRASLRSTGSEHAWVSLDIGITCVLVEPTAR